MPLVKLWPDDPRMENAVMFVPNNESTKTNGPSDRPARKKSSAPRATVWRNAKIPM